MSGSNDRDPPPNRETSAKRGKGAGKPADNERVLPDSTLASLIFTFSMVPPGKGVAFLSRMGMEKRSNWLTATRKQIKAGIYTNLHKMTDKQIDLAAEWRAEQEEGSLRSRVDQVKGTGKDYLFFAMCGFLDADLDSQKEAAAVLPGTYRLYRPSTKVPGSFTMAMFVIEESESGALITREERILRSGRGEPIVNEWDMRSDGNGETLSQREERLKRQDIAWKTWKKSYEESTQTQKGQNKSELSAPTKIEERPIYERFNGIIFRKRRRYIGIQRSETGENFVITVFNDEFYDGGPGPKRMAALAGVAYGTVGSRLYTAKVMIDRVTDIPEVPPNLAGEDRERALKLREAGVRASLNYLPEDLIPGSVRHTLEFPDIKNNTHAIF